MRSVPGAVIGKVSDRTFLMHLGGKIEMAAKHPIHNRDDLAMLYTWCGSRPAWRSPRTQPTPADSPSNATAWPSSLTDQRSSGWATSACTAALPVMEGKAALFKRFAGIDAWPLSLDTQDVEEIVTVARAIAPGFAGINLEDTRARCASRSRPCTPRALLDIPVFHDDQHGTAIVVLAALYNASA